MKLSNFVDYFKACSLVNIGVFTLFYILTNVAIFINQYFLTKWSDEEELQSINATLPNGEYSDPPRTEEFLQERDYNLIIFVVTGALPRIIH